MLRFAIIVSFVVMGCKDEKQPAAGAAGGAGSSTGGMNMGSNPAGVIPASKGPKLTCDHVATAAVKDKFFKDYDVKDVSQSNDWQAQCEIKHKTDAMKIGSIQTSCHPEVVSEASRTRANAELKKMFKDAKDVPDVGVSAVQLKAGSLTSYNEGCQLNVNVPDGLDPIAISKEILTLIPPKS